MQPDYQLVPKREMQSGSAIQLHNPAQNADADFANYLSTRHVAPRSTNYPAQYEAPPPVARMPLTIAQKATITVLTCTAGAYALIHTVGLYLGTAGIAGCGILFIVFWALSTGGKRLYYDTPRPQKPIAPTKIQVNNIHIHIHQD